MTRKVPTDIAASVRARLLNLAKKRGEDFNLTLVNYAAERFLYRLSRSVRRNQFILKGAMLFAVIVGELYRPTRDLDLLGRGEATEDAVEAAIRDIVAGTSTDDDGLDFDTDSLRVQRIRENVRYGGIRVQLQARLAQARIPVQIDIGFGDAITPAPLNLTFPTLLAELPSPNVLAYPLETIVAEKTQAMVDLGILNSRMKDFADVAMAARHLVFDGETLVAALQATFGRRETPLPDNEFVALSQPFVEDAKARANWKAFVIRTRWRHSESLAGIVLELRRFLLLPLSHARSGEPFQASWKPGGPWKRRGELE